MGPTVPSYILFCASGFGNLLLDEPQPRAKPEPYRISWHDIFVEDNGHVRYVGDAKTPRQDRAQTIINLLTKVFAEMGIKGVSSPRGRRQFITELASRGFNARVLRSIRYDGSQTILGAKHRL